MAGKTLENKDKKNKRGKGGFGDHPENINRQGRPPKGYAFADALNDVLDMTGFEMKLEETLAGENLDGLTRLQLVARATVLAGMQGNGAALRIIRDTKDGLPTQNLRFLGAAKELKISFPDLPPAPAADPDVEMSSDKPQPEKAVGTPSAPAAPVATPPQSPAKKPRKGKSRSPYAGRGRK